jgi:hypothetical protein
MAKSSRLRRHHSADAFDQNPGLQQAAWQGIPNEPVALLVATMGSTLAARRAGKQHAHISTAIRISETAMKAGGSVGFTA